MPIERLCARAGVTTANAWVASDFFCLWSAAEEEFHDPRAGLRFGDEGIAQGSAALPEPAGWSLPGMSEQSGA